MNEDISIETDEQHDDDRRGHDEGAWVAAARRDGDAADVRCGGGHGAASRADAGSRWSAVSG